MSDYEKTKTHQALLKALRRAEEAHGSPNNFQLTELEMEYGGPAPGAAGGIVRRWPARGHVIRQTNVGRDQEVAYVMARAAPAVDERRLVIHTFHHFGSCRVLRHHHVRQHAISMDTGALAEDVKPAEWRTEPCRVPLFKDEDRERGSCSSCAAGWKAPGNLPANPLARYRDPDDMDANAHTFSLEEFLRDNEGLEPDLAARIEALAPGESLEQDEGAGGSWRIMRIADASVVPGELLCDACGWPTGFDYRTDDEVCKGGDGPGFHLCGREPCEARRAKLNVEERAAVYAAGRAEQRRHL